jgi:type II secretory pathway component GspD/PulD (secretin)
VINAQAGAIPFPDENVSYNLHGEQLKDFLKRFFNDMGIAVSLSDLVQTESGSLNGPRSGKAAAVCRSIMDSNGLVGYYDGSVAYVYKNRELADRFFRIESERMDAFRAATVNSGLPDASNTLRINAGMAHRASLISSGSSTPHLRFARRLRSASPRRHTSRRRRRGGQRPPARPCI